MNHYYDACPCWSVLVSHDEIVNVVSWGYYCLHQVCCCQTGLQCLLSHCQNLLGPSYGLPGSGVAAPPPFGPDPPHLAEINSKAGNVEKLFVAVLIYTSFTMLLISSIIHTKFSDIWLFIFSAIMHHVNCIVKSLSEQELTQKHNDYGNELLCHIT